MYYLKNVKRFSMFSTLLSFTISINLLIILYRGSYARATRDFGRSNFPANIILFAVSKSF